MYETALDQLRLRWREGNHYIGKDDVAAWSKNAELSATKVFDQLAIELSSDFWVGFLGWDFVDGVANALYGALLEFVGAEADFKWPDAFDEFYQAFDHSEIQGPRDRELIRTFLSKHKNLTA